MNRKISIVLPCYNESESIDNFFEVVIPVLSSVSSEFEIVCINDGSRDDTFEKLKAQRKKFSQIKIIDFSKNFGKDAAMTAGIDFATGDCVIPMDVDLQDPPELIPEMVKLWKDGADVVLAKREDRSDDTFVKKITAGLFYKVFNKLSDLKIPENVGDFRLMDRKVVDVVKSFPERTRFMKGLLALAGFKAAYVGYKRPSRAHGQSKWNYWKLWNYALDGVTSFSTFPLKISTYLGFITTIFACLYIAKIVFKVLFYGIDVPGYPSLMSVILFFGGVQLISLGIIGEYIGRIFIESKHRPIYVIREIVDDKNSSDVLLQK
ncbi:MAG: glycosyltransferase family 2 protein [Alphaproteobacteria bacterium]|nr:glycosyltransferase family 2 protein [Alphaproteobacteria bacterium]